MVRASDPRRDISLDEDVAQFGVVVTSGTVTVSRVDRIAGVLVIRRDVRTPRSLDVVVVHVNSEEEVPALIQNEKLSSTAD